MYTKAKVSVLARRSRANDYRRADDDHCIPPGWRLTVNKFGDYEMSRDK
jgi:hypothetical protein